MLLSHNALSQLDAFRRKDVQSLWMPLKRRTPPQHHADIRRIVIDRLERTRLDRNWRVAEHRRRFHPFLVQVDGEGAPVAPPLQPLQVLPFDEHRLGELDDIAGRIQQQAEKMRLHMVVEAHRIPKPGQVFQLDVVKGGMGFPKGQRHDVTVQLLDVIAAWG